MQRAIRCIAVMILLFSGAYAQWQPLDGTVNAPWYGTARCFSTVVWNDQRWIFAADGIGRLYRSSDNGGTWDWQTDPILFNDITFILADPYPDRNGYIYAARYNVDQPNINGFWRSTDYGLTFIRQNGDDCNNPPYQAPLGNLKINAIRKYEAPGGSLTEQQFHDVIVVCRVQEGIDDNLISYHSDPDAATMCWERLFTFFDNCDVDGYCYDGADFAQNRYYADSLSDSLEIILAEGDLTEPQRGHTNYGVWRIDESNPTWEHILRFRSQNGYYVPAGTRFFRYKNSDITTWPFYEFGSMLLSISA